jgi:formylglycine-generating enzyme required for sulfatase activity
MQWTVWLGAVIAILLLAGCGGKPADDVAQATAIAGRVLATLTAEALSTPTPSDQVKSVAERAFAAWAEVRGVPYREALITVESNDNVYANLRVVAWFRPAQTAPWEEWEATMECRYVGKEWQCNQGLDFALTAGEWGRRAAQTATTEAAMAAAEAATAEVWAVTATAEALERATAVAATATAEAPERATAQAEGKLLWTNAVDRAGYLPVPAGEFLMGANDGNSDEKPQHTVYLDFFWIMQTEVTNVQYGWCVAAGGCTAPGSTASSTRSEYYGRTEYADYPMINVDWMQADAYCRWAGGRLPTEAEWEKAARGTDGRIYPWGNEVPDARRANYATFASSVGDTTSAGNYPSGASPYGALDMAGNVWEWTADWYDAYYYARAPAPGRNPTGPASGDYRVLRGGGCDRYGSNLRVASRRSYYPTGMDDFVGFRCVAAPEK